jgi:hypothetical protein
MLRARQPPFIAEHGLGKQTSILREENYATQVKIPREIYFFVTFYFSRSFSALCISR